MPRRRKTSTTPVETSVATEMSPDVGSNLPLESTTTRGGAIEAPDAPAVTVAAEPTTADAMLTENPEPPESRGRFRSWVNDSVRGYHRLTDEQEHRLVLLFNDKPSADALLAVKGAGFQYHPDYFGLKHAWVRRNDFEGRLQVEAIEKLIGTTPQRESTGR
jgi:hypothetical protein